MPDNNDQYKKYLDYDGLDYLIQRIPRTKIKVTFDDVFAGETATCSMGTTTYTKTVPATEPYELVFPVNELGTWTIATSYLGDDYGTTIEVTAIGQTATGHVSHVTEIDGATVTPTDDITTWLKCANIEDPTITTLADVLANRSLFETLIANSNACKYMARSTSWSAGGPNGLVPTMTDNTHPSGEAFYADEDPSYKAYKMFDGDTSNRGTRNYTTNTTPLWWGYKFAQATVVNKLNIKVYAQSGKPTSLPFKLQGSNDGTTYVDIDTEKTITNLSTNAQCDNTFTFNNSTAYLYYRCYTTTPMFINGSYLLYVDELQFYNTGTIVGNQDAMSLIGKYDYCSNALLSNATWAEAIANSDYFEEVLNVKVPTMTSNTAPSGTVRATSIFGSSYDAYLAFDNNASTAWWSTAVTPTSANQRLSYEFTSPVIINRVFILGYNESGSVRIKNYKIGYSDDGITWNDTLASDTYTSSDTSGKIISFANNTPHKYYSIYVEDIWDSSYVVIKTLQFYGRASSEVFVTKSPIMTSETTPSGECFGSTYLNGGWTWFRSMMDGTNSPTCLLTKGGSLYWGYKFATPTVINAIQFQEFGNNSSVGLGNLFNHGVLKGSNDNENWTTLLTIDQTPVSGKVYYYTFQNTTAYQYYKLDELTCTGDTYVQVGKYWKFGVSQAQTNIIHSAPNDTIYMMENGSQVPLCTTNSDGDGILDFTQFMDGTYTLYSSVAKDPTNLSNDYSKSVRITKTSYGCTTEAYLMPDTIKTLYWFGWDSGLIEDCVSANGWSWSGVGLGTPTHNTNDITLSSAMEGVKNIIDGTHNVVVEGVTIVAGTYGSIGATPSKAVSGSDWTEFSTSGKLLLSKAVSNKYCIIPAVNGRSLKIYAWWYE